MKRLFFWLCLSPLAFAGANAKDQALSYAQQVQISSKVFASDVAVNIALPSEHQISSDKHVYPLVMVFGSHFFAVTANLVEFLGNQGQMPRAIVVNLPDMPSHAPNVHANGMWGPNRKTLDFNADPTKLSRFIRDELLPFLKSQYRLADYRIAIGASAGSVYLFHSFIHEPDLFQAHITVASADMMGMGYAEGETFIDAFATHLAANKQRSAFFYATSGGSDALPDSKERRNFETFEREMAAYRSQTRFLKTAIFPDHGHYESWVPALTHGLKYLFPNALWGVDYRSFENEPGKALQNLDAHYQMLSQRYGFPILPDAYRWNLGSCLNGMGRRLLQQGRFEEAIAVYERYVTYHPKSENAKAALKKARAAYQDAQSK